MAFVAEQLKTIGFTEQSLNHVIPRCEAGGRIDDGMDVVDHRIVDAALVTGFWGEGGRNRMGLPLITSTAIDTSV